MIRKQDRQIEDKPYYVYMIDSFLSGWGEANNRVAILLLGCDTREEAEVVRDNALARGDMRNVSIDSAPGEDKRLWARRVNDVVQYHDKTDYHKWYEKDWFRKQGGKA